MTELPSGASPVDGIQPGTRLREWEIVRFVGRGSYGVVFEARRSSWRAEPPRALKIFDPIVSSAARSTLLAEFSTLTDVHDPHLLTGIDAFDLVEPPYAGCVVFVLELADEDLSHRVARTGPLQPAEAASVVADVAEGLAALHDQGRIHGDVKPENILRVGERWVLGDFGVTSVLEGSYAVTHAATVDYRPPEAASAADGTRQHRSADVWALGVSLHVAATGRHPFPGPDPMMRFAAAVRGDRAVVPGLDPGLASIIDDGCLVADPHRRLEAAGVAARLRRLAGSLSPAPDATTPGLHRPPVSGSDPSPAHGGATARHAAAAAPVPDPPPVGRPPVPAPPAPAAMPGPGHWAEASSSRRSWLVLALAVVATVVLTQVVAVACGAVLDDVGTRRVAYLVATVALLVAALVWFVRRARAGAPGAPDVRPAPAVLAGCVTAAWLASTVVLFV